MKRTALLILLLTPIALTGCQTIRAHNPFRHKEPAYKSAQQERPLEVPPGMNQPPTTEALAIPTASTTPATASTASMTQPETGTTPPGPVAPATAASGSSSLTLKDTPASVYHRVGLALARGEAGQVTQHDDTTMTYQVAVDTVVTQKPEGGFLHRLFHRSHSETVKGDVTVSVVPEGTGSLVQASGNPAAAAKVIAVLRQRLK